MGLVTDTTAGGVWSVVYDGRYKEALRIGQSRLARG
jgi:hypothetical protein